MSRFALEAAAYAAFIKLQEEATRCKQLFVDARLNIPEPLGRFLDEETSVRLPSETRRITVPAPTRPARPKDAEQEWVSVPLEAAVETTLVTSALRAATGPKTPSDVFDEISRMRPDAVKGTIANIGTRLGQSGVIARNDGIWSLSHPERAPIIVDGYVWGPVEGFEKQELAAYRREVILHVLRSSSDGQQIVQIVKTIEEFCPWFHREVPLNKDLVKMDMIALADAKKARKTGRSGKWFAM